MKGINIPRLLPTYIALWATLYLWPKTPIETSSSYDWFGVAYLISCRIPEQKSRVSPEEDHWSAGMPKKITCGHLLCVKVCWMLYMSNILLRCVTGFTDFTFSLVSLWTYSWKLPLWAKRRESFQELGGYWFWMFLCPNLTQPRKKVHWPTPFGLRSKGYMGILTFFQWV